MKIHPVGAELFHADGRMDRHDEAHSRLSQFCKHAQKWLSTQLTMLLLYYLSFYLSLVFVLCKDN